MGAVIILGAGSFFFLSRQPSSETTVLSPVSTQATPAKILPSSTLKEYTDPSGFSFNYPDDLSLLKNETINEQIYADLQLRSKGAGESLDLKIEDTKLASVEEWFEENGRIANQAKDVKWGELSAKSLEDKDKILIAAVDQGVLFTIDIFFGSHKDFWQKVSDPILTSFAFGSESSSGTSPQTGGGSEEDVIFEGEEVVE